jgi:hypothetical protein
MCCHRSVVVNRGNGSSPPNRGVAPHLGKSRGIGGKRADDRDVFRVITGQARWYRFAMQLGEPRFREGIKNIHAVRRRYGAVSSTAVCCRIPTLTPSVRTYLARQYQTGRPDPKVQTSSSVKKEVHMQVFDSIDDKRPTKPCTRGRLGISSSHCSECGWVCRHRASAKIAMI